MPIPKKLSRRNFLQGASLTLAGATLAACSPAVQPTSSNTAATQVPVAQATQAQVVQPTPTQPAAQPPAAAAVTISLISWWNKPFQVMAPKFTAKNPNINLKFIDAGSGYKEKVMTALASGSELADIAGSQDIDLLQYVDTGGVADISQDMAPYKDKLVEYKLNLGVVEGKNYAVPWDGSPCLLYYRRDICTQFEIDPEKITTYDDWAQAGRILGKATDGKVRLFGFDEADTWPFINWTFQLGGGLYDANETKVLIDGPEPVQVLKFMKQAWDDKVVHQNMGWDPQQASFKDGTSAMFPSAIWMADTIKGNAPETIGKWGVVKMPAWMNGGSQVTTYGGSQLMIMKTSQNIEAAFKFLEYSQLSQEGQEIGWTDGALFPVLKDAVNWPILQDPVEFYGGQAALKLYAEVNALVKPYIWGKGWGESATIMTQQIAQALEGKKAPDQALADAAKEIRTKQKLA
jgi:lactose/L-arabinose transport system substrate-binding protein